MKRSLLIIALGVAFLILITWIGTFLTSFIPYPASAQIQTRQIGPYQVTLHVDPNPPPITRSEVLSIQILLNTSQQPVSNARVTLESSMETMDMGTDSTEAQSQGNGMYLATVQFSMSGPWKVQVVVSLPEGTKSFSAMFEVTAQ
ncbi:MAG: FixH family protein [Ktedonobacteraceae bacterium]